MEEEGGRMKGVRHMVLGMIAASVVALVGLIWLLQAPAHADPQSPVVLPGGWWCTIHRAHESAFWVGENACV